MPESEMEFGHFWPPLHKNQERQRGKGGKLRHVMISGRQPFGNVQKVDFALLHRVDGNGANKAAGSDFGSAALKTESTRGELCPAKDRNQLRR